jgi:hypothetical protein
MPMPASSFQLDNSYARELQGFSVPWKPEPVPAPTWLFFNAPLADELGLDVAALSGDEGAALFAGNTVPPGAEPIAQAYAGHQFGGFSPQLGDGRAILLGEVIDRAGHRRDIAFKGSGRTPFSRGGDGKAAVGPMLREALVGEWMHAVGIPTTRALAVATGQLVLRGSCCPARCARVAASHIRVGTFQFFAARGDLGACATRRVHDRAPRPGACRRLVASGACRERRGAPGGADRAVDKRRLHPRRDEHRQHDALRRDDRLRPVRVRRDATRPRVQLDRHAGSLRVRQPAEIARGTRAPGRDAAAAARDDLEQARAQAIEVLCAFPALYRAGLLTGQRAGSALAASKVQTTPPTPRSPPSRSPCCTPDAPTSRLRGAAWPMPRPGTRRRCAPRSRTRAHPTHGSRAGASAARARTKVRRGRATPLPRVPRACAASAPS